MNNHGFDVIIIGAGAAGMMCGAVAGRRGRKVLIVDHAKAAGEKIRISGGGRCNFTNIHCEPRHFISQNPHFCKSALAGYTPQDFIALVKSYGIAWHEKTKGQLFCDERATQIVSMLREECAKGGNELRLGCTINAVAKNEAGFTVSTTQGDFSAPAIVVACGGPSIPKMGASGFGYALARQFGLSLIEPCAALVPLTFTDALKAPIKALAGVSAPARVGCGKTVFDEAVLFTHRGLSGPAILQISSYWSPGDSIRVDFAPQCALLGKLKEARLNTPRQNPIAVLSGFLPARLAQFLAPQAAQLRLADMSDKALAGLCAQVKCWTVKPSGSEGFRTAEVTKGGVDVRALSSKTMQASAVPGLYFIGEVVDVTGHLGGHNFQWAWASGVAAGNAL